MTDLLIAFVTAGGEVDAGRIARTVVEDGLAACVTIVPAIRSIYRWEGSIEDEGESLLIIKTARGLLEDLKVRIREIHPYDVPELIAVPVEDGLEEYLDWAIGEMRNSGPKGRDGDDQGVS